MVTIDTSSLTTWESADRIDALGLDFVSHTESVRTRVDEMNGDWKGIDPHYAGVGNQELVDGLMPAVRQANQLANAGVAADGALLTFADRLRTLTTDRDSFESDVAVFEAAHGGEALEELESGPRTEYNRLDGKAGTLQGDYDSAISTCISALNEIRPETVSSESPAERGAGGLHFGIEEATMTAAVGGAAAETGVARSARMGAHATRPSTSFHLTSFGRHIRFLDPVMAVASQPRQAWTAMVNSSSPDGRHRGTPAQTADTRTSRAIRTHLLPSDGRIGSAFLNGLPFVGDARATRRPAAVPTTVDGTEARMARGSRLIGVGGRALGTAGTLLSVGTTYREERESETAQVAAENPELGRQQVEQRATENAVAGTVGRVGSSVLASAAVGAAAGTVLPGPGNVVGFVAGLATGLAMEVPIADVDGDGQRDSLSKMAGEGLKNAWGWVRGR